MLIAVDWGTTSFRAYRVAANGAIVDRMDAEAGILSVPAGGFPAAFARLLGPWLADAPPVILSGMIGSRQGWVECPYVSCPAGRADLAANLVPLDTPAGLRLHFVPGVRTAATAAVPDVMRGEETQIMGELDAAGAGTAVFLLPGTHSKWAVVEQGQITRFATFMTGEVFGVLSRHSILGRLMEGESADIVAFDRGLDQARSGSLLHDLFGVRTLGLFGELRPGQLSSYLSGVLIGHEVRAASIAYPAAADADPVTVIGSPSLTELYVTALAHAGRRTRAGTPDAAARGLFAMAGAAGLLPS